MKIFPAIDLSGGRVVRLTRGDYDQMTVYGSDPAATAREFAGVGAKYLHVVDLDGAKDGSAANFRAVADIAAAAELFIEVGGGIRSEERIRQYLELGVDRVILGTAAVENFAFTKEMAAKFGEQIAVGVDARSGRVAIRGWLEETELECEEFCQRLAGAGIRRVIVTDIERDGVLSGANIPLYQRLAQIPGLKVIASGGVSSPAEIKELAAAGAEGAIIGKALYTGKLSLAECLESARAAGGED